MTTNLFGGLSSLNSLLNKNLNSLRDSFTKLSSGKRINKAADDAAGLAIAESLNANAAALKVANRNVSDTQSALQITDGALSQIGEISTRLKELATQASNGTLSDSQRSALNTEYNELTQEVQRITDTTEFNGTKLLNGSSITSQVDINSGSDSQISTPGVSISSAVSSVASQSIATQSGAQAALSQIDNLIQQNAATRGQIGASSSRLEFAKNNNSVKFENTRAAESRIRDVDVAEETANVTKRNILANASTAISAQAGRLNRDVVLGLLK